MLLALPVLVGLSPHLVHLVDRDAGASPDLLCIRWREGRPALDDRRLLYAGVLLGLALAAADVHLPRLHDVPDGLPR